MTIEELRALIAKVEETDGDTEVAHLLDDLMRSSVLRAIANGTAEDAREMARMALSTDHIERWYA